MKVLVHGDTGKLGSGKLRTVVTTASHLELMCSCDLEVGIEMVVPFTPSMPVTVADVRHCQELLRYHVQIELLGPIVMISHHDLLLARDCDASARSGLLIVSGLAK